MQRTTKFYDRIGERFGKLIVLEIVKKEVFYAKVKCDCGGEKLVAVTSLASGGTKSCGCMWNKQGWRGLGKKHGLSKTDLYRTWDSMKRRCLNKMDVNYHNYGERGISICKEWLNDFMAFYNWSLENGYKKGLQIDRKNNNGNYEPSNCRWATPLVNSNNTRKTIYVEDDGGKLSLMDMSRKYKIPRSTLYGRYLKERNLLNDYKYLRKCKNPIS